jgi:flagellar hook-length control protein FliK
LSAEVMGVVDPVQVQMAMQTHEAEALLRPGESAPLKAQLATGMFTFADPDLNPSINPSISPRDGSQAPVKTDDRLASQQPAMRNTMEGLDNALRAMVVQPETGVVAGMRKGATPGSAPDIASTQAGSAEVEKTRGSGVVQETLRAAVARGNNALVAGEDARSLANPDVLSRPVLPAKSAQVSTSSTSNALSTAAITTGATLYAGPLTNQFREIQLEMARAANAAPDPLDSSTNKNMNGMARVLPNQSLQRAAQANLASSALPVVNRAADLASAPDSSLSLEAAERASPTAPRTEPSALAALKPTVVAAPTSGGDAQVRGMDAEVREQIMRVMSRAALAQGKLTLQLNPHELGSLDIEFSTDKGEMQVAIVAREVATRDLLEASVARLRQNLQDAGVNVGQLDIRQDQDSNPSQQFDQSGNQSRQAGVVTTEQAGDEVQISSSRHDGDFDIYV